jgi:hypothetical protein
MDDPRWSADFERAAGSAAAPRFVSRFGSDFNFGIF